ncbi:MAG: hypothetical protein ACFFBE_05010, partial [Promethearchaeota archaeon]
YIDGDSYIYVGTYNSFGQPTWNTTWGHEMAMINEPWGVRLDRFDNIYVSGYTEYYEGNHDMSVLLKYSKLINKSPPTIQGYSLISLFGVNSLLLVVLIRKKIKK